MRIAIVTEGFRPYIGGVETRYTKFAENLSKKHEVDVLTIIQNNVPIGDREVLEEEELDRLKIYRLNVGEDYFLKDGTRSIKGVIRLCRWCNGLMIKNDYDAVLVSEWPLLHILYVYVRSSLGVKMVVDWHEVWGKYYFNFGVKGVAGFLIERIIAKLKKLRHIAVSEFTRERLKHILKISKEIPVIWNGVDPKEYDRLGNIQKERGKIVFFGRFAPHKNIELLLEAYKILKKLYRDISIHIIGDGPLRDKIAKLVSQIDDAHLHISLSREELLRHIKSSYVAVIPSNREGQGISYLEAMAAGTPVISIMSPNNAFSNMVRNGEEAIISRPDPISIAESIRKILENDEMWRKLSINGMRFAYAFSWDNACSKLEKILTEVSEG